MAHLKRTGLVLLLAGGIATAAPADGSTYRLEVAGLACPFCAYGIEKRLNRIEGVERLETHIKEGAVVVAMKEGATLDEATAKRAVEEAGFTLNGFERESSGGSE